jgi:hypothetical protein
MLRGSLAKVFATVLMLALVLKPCFGLLTQESVAAASTDLPRAAVSAELTGDDSSSDSCKRKCLVSRHEEAVGVALLSLTKASGQPELLAPQAIAWPIAAHVPKPVVAALDIEPRKRLALLSRLLL